LAGLCGGSVTAGEDAVNAADIAALTVASASIEAAVGADLPSSSTVLAKSLRDNMPWMFLSSVVSLKAAARSGAVAAFILVL
jgi:hypothetical protein